MKYSEALDKILSIPMFQNVGMAAFVPTLEGSVKLNTLTGNPYNNYPTIHIAGTNGKGSTSNILTSALMEQGYKVGCYTSPHLTDYRERVRINGKNVSQQIVCDFMDILGDAIDTYHPSFFEVTTALAFYAFSCEKVDIAIIETGLGGLTDSTNIITPILSVVTNIGYDHKYILGNSLAEIAYQKAGIIKSYVPSVVGERGVESDAVFVEVAKEKNSELLFAEDIAKCVECNSQSVTYEVSGKQITLSPDLKGDYQIKNIATALVAIATLNKGGVVYISEEAIKRGVSRIALNSSLEGRWQTICDAPLTICDTGHNQHGIRYVVGQLSKLNVSKLHIIIGFMSDKEVLEILGMFPKTAHYFFATASNPRSMLSGELKERAAILGLSGEAFSSVAEAYDAARSVAHSDDAIFIGGSTFIVADFLNHISLNR